MQLVRVLGKTDKALRILSRQAVSLATLQPIIDLIQYKITMHHIDNIE